MSHRVLILGGGFCGLEVARQLSGRVDMDVTLVEPETHALFTPRLVDALAQQVRETDMHAEHQQIADRRGYAFIQGKALAIDEQKKRVDVTLASQKIKTFAYDTLVCAYGAQTNYFQLEGKEHAYPFKTWEDLLAIEERLQPLVRQKKQPNIAIIGGGATGIEIAFALNYRLALLGCDPDRRTFTIFQAGPQILPGFLPKTVEQTTRLMETQKMGLRLSTPVRSLSKTSLTTQQGENIPTDLVVWAAGVRPNMVENRTPTTDPKGACIVDHTLKLAPDIYAGGDVIHFQDRQQVIPKNAQTALKMGTHIAKNILREAANKPPVSFHYRSAGALLWLGQTATFDLARISILSKGIIWLRDALYSLRWRQMTR